MGCCWAYGSERRKFRSNMETFFDAQQDEIFASNDTNEEAEWITSTSITTWSARSSEGGGGGNVSSSSSSLDAFLSKSDQMETILSNNLNDVNNASFPHRIHGRDEDNNINWTGTSFPSTFEVGDMAENDNSLSKNLSGNCPLDKQSQHETFVLGRYILTLPFG